MRSITIAALAFLFLLTAADPAQAQAGRDLFQQALVKERADGDLRGAISIYERIAREFTSDRPLAASALVQLGQCYEKLGSAEAERAYQRVVREFADQAELVAEARARLVALRAATAVVASEGLMARRLQEDDGCKIAFMKPSPDGKLLAYNDLCETLAIHVLDLASGTTEQITTENMHFGVAWSPDGRRIATGELVPGQQLKIIDLETGDVQEVAHMAGVAFIPDEWSNDGDHISGSVRGGGRSTMIVSLSSGERIPLASSIALSTPRATFSPDSRYVAFAEFAGDNQDIYVQSLATGERQRVTTGPKADWGAVWSPDGTALVYHNTDGTWALQIADGQASGDPQLLSSIPYGHDQAANSWTSDGYFYASENTVTNAVRIPVDPETAQSLGPPELIPEVMPGLGAGGNSYFAWSPDMERVASTGGEDRHNIHLSRGQSVTSFHIGQEATVWGIWWSGDGSEVLYTTRRGGQRDPRRTVYALNPTDGSIRELFPPVESISHVHVSADGERMVFLTHPDGAPLSNPAQLAVSDLGDPTNGRVLATGSDAEGWLSTQITQPAFSPDGSHVMFIRRHTGEESPDDYEMSLWVVPADGSSPARQLDRSRGIDRAFWDPSGRWLVFRGPDGPESPDGSGTLSAVSIETGEGHEILGTADLESMGITGVTLRAWSPDGRWIGATETKGGFEFWVIANLLDGSSGR